MIAQLFLLVVSLGFAFAPDVAGYSGTPEAICAHLVGPLLASFAVASCFPSLSFTRYISSWIGFALAISPFAFYFADPTALIIQAVIGLWVMAFAMLSHPIHETGGWRRALKHIDEVDLDWA